jgi:glycine betaine/proline transport system substrate-binding protein
MPLVISLILHIASSQVVENVLESFGYKIELIQVDAGTMWAGIAEGSGDAMVGAWFFI